MYISVSDRWITKAATKTVFYPQTTGSQRIAMFLLAGVQHHTEAGNALASEDRGYTPRQVYWQKRSILSENAMVNTSAAKVSKSQHDQMTLQAAISPES